jgi:hypothetical protein
MPAHRNWKRRVDVTAPLASWQRLGQLLLVRRRTIGYTWRTDFERDRRVNRRLAADIESAAKGRVNTFTNGSLGLVAQGYAVDYDSILAVLRGEADELVPVPVAPVNPDLVPVPPAAGWPDESPPMSPAQADADRPWFGPVNERRFALAARGILDPTGEQMFGAGTEDARAWDGPFGRSLPIGDRCWFIAELRRLAAGRNAGPNSGTGTTGALSRSYFAGQGVMWRLPVMT